MVGKAIAHYQVIEKIGEMRYVQPMRPATSDRTAAPTPTSRNNFSSFGRASTYRSCSRGAPGIGRLLGPIFRLQPQDCPLTGFGHQSQQNSRTIWPG